MLAGGAELGLVHGRLRSPLWRLTLAARVRRHRAPRSSSTSRTRGSSRAPRSCTTCSAGRSSSRRSSRSLLVWRPRSAVLQSGFALMIVTVSVMLFCRPRRGADLRPPLAARRGAAPVRRLRSPIALAALAFPAAASAHATLRVDDAGASARSCSRRRATIRLHFDQIVKILPGRSRCSTASAANFAGTARAERDRRRRAGARADAGRVHRALAGGLGRLARRLGRLDVRRARARAVGQRRLRRRRPDAHRARRALAVVPRARARRSARSGCG